jgi:hypothetical protein
MRSTMAAPWSAAPAAPPAPADPRRDESGHGRGWGGDPDGDLHEVTPTRTVGMVDGRQAVG